MAYSDVYMLLVFHAGGQGTSALLWALNEDLLPGHALMVAEGKKVKHQASHAAVHKTSA